MCAMLKTATIWQFSNPSLRSTYEAMFSPRNAASVMQAQDRSENGLTDPMAKLIEQSFSIAFSHELHVRNLIAERVAMRTGIGIEKIRGGRRRTRVELDVIAKVPRATQSELIDALGAAKRKCSVLVGSDIKIVLKAELKLDGSALEI